MNSFEEKISGHAWTCTRLCTTSILVPSGPAPLVCTNNRDFWEGSTPEVRDSWRSCQIKRIWLAENTKGIVCAFSCKSRFLVLAKKGAASENENVPHHLQIITHQIFLIRARHVTEYSPAKTLEYSTLVYTTQFSEQYFSRALIG